MSRAWIELTLWMGTLFATSAAGVRWARPQPATDLVPPQALHASPWPRDWSAGRLAEAADTLIANNPFRLDRRPVNAPFGESDATGEYIAEEPSPGFPRLLVTAVLGPPWQAVVEGFPERSGGVLVSSGDVVGELVVQSVRRDTVVIQSADTSWILILGTKW